VPKIQERADFRQLPQKKCIRISLFLDFKLFGNLPSYKNRIWRAETLSLFISELNLQPKKKPFLAFLLKQLLKYFSLKIS